MSESVCFIITLSTVYSKHAVINTPSEAEERGKEREREAKEGKEESLEKQIWSKLYIWKIDILSHFYN